MKNKRYLFVGILIFWMLIIFLFSSQNAKSSKITSDKVVTKMIESYEIITNNNLNNRKKEQIIDNTRFLARKTAHFTAYFILGVIVYLIFTTYSVKKPILYTIIFCLIYSCSDEIHQLFSPGRTARVLDCFIDTCGSSCGCLLIKYEKKYRK